MRFGLVGTGHWAQIAHAPAMARAEGIEFAAVWGRNRRAGEALSARYKTITYDDFDAFLGSVDCVAFAVPPDVQVRLALKAAKAGKHVLLEKPIATSDADADMLVRAVESTGVASVVFFTFRFQAPVRAWLASIATQGPWTGGSFVWLASALRDGNPFNTSWRHDKGSLWDLGPHVVSLLWACLGEVVSVTAEPGPADVTHLILHHQAGATSAAMLTLGAPATAETCELYLWGESGRAVAPLQKGEATTALGAALADLAHNARSGQATHPCDVRFGRDIGRVLANAQCQIDVRRASLTSRALRGPSPAEVVS